MELFLLDDQSQAARQFSDKINQAVHESTAFLAAAASGAADLVFVGGDAFLVILPAGPSYREICTEVQSIFQQTSGCTLSIGLGPDAKTAANALRRAKLLGKNRIVSIGLTDGNRE
jgi:GTP cyclohydrolase III